MTSERDDLDDVVAPSPSDVVTTSDAGPTESELTEPDRDVLAFEAEQAAVQEKRRRRQKHLRLAALWWQKGCWRFGAAFRRFPGWVAAVTAAGIAVVLSLILLFIHFFWTSPTDDQTPQVADVRRTALSDEDAYPAAELGAPEHDEEFSRYVNGDNDDGPAPVSPPVQRPEWDADVFSEEDPFDTDSPIDSRTEIAENLLDIDVTSHTVAGLPREDEWFTVSSQNSADSINFGPGEDRDFAAIDPLWQPFGSARVSADDFAVSEQSSFTVDADDAGSVSKNAAAAEERLWKEVDADRSRLTTRDEADASLSSLREMHLNVEPVADAGSPSVVSGWVIKNDGPSDIESLAIDPMRSDGLMVQRGEWRDDQGMIPSNWRFRDLPTRSAKTVMFSVLAQAVQAGDGNDATVASTANEPIEKELPVVETTLQIRVAGAISAATRIDAPRLKLTWTQPPTIAPGKVFVVDFEVENTGLLTVEGIRIEADLDEGLVHRYGRRIVYKVGTLAAGQVFNCQMFLTASQGGRLEKEIRLTSGATVFQSEKLMFDVPASETAVGAPRDQF